MLIIGSSTPVTQTPFLSEAELPEHARLNQRGGGSLLSTDETMDDDRQLAEALHRSQADSASSE